MPEVLRIWKGYSPKGTRRVLEAIDKATAKIGVGDRVRWNGYVGQVLAVQGDTAIVEEVDNIALGRPVKWRLLLSSVTRMDPDPC